MANINNMNVIIIHGPPWVGKYTVSKELSKIVDYKLIHIHSIYDFLEDIFSEDNYFVSLGVLNNIYINIIDEAGKLWLKWIIFTYADVVRDDFNFLRTLKRVIHKNNSTLRAVNLTCNTDELKKRVVADSRKQYKKTHSVEDLEHFLSYKDYKSNFPEIETLNIDNTYISPKNAAIRIKDYYSIS